MIILNLLIVSLVSYLCYLGGQKNGKIYRRIAIPMLMGLYFAIKYKIWLFLAVGGGLQLIGLGYGNYDPENDPKPSFLALLTHDHNGWYIRLIWGFLVALGASLGLILGHFMPIWGFLAYLLGNSAICFCVSRFRLPVLWSDLAVGLGIASLIFF